MKTLLKIVLVVAVIALVVAGTLMALEINQGLSYDSSQVENIGSDVQIVSETEDSVTLKKKSKDEFKVLMFTDTHLNGKKETDIITASYIIKNITEEKPDLVIFGGDAPQTCRLICVQKNKSSNLTLLLRWCETGCGCPVDTSVHSTEAPTEAAAETLNPYESPHNGLLRCPKFITACSAYEF